MKPIILERLGALTQDKVEEFIAGLTDEEALSILSAWDLWALPYQRLPEGGWRRWVLRAGRGTGKSYAGSENVNALAEDRSKIRRGEIGIIGRTWSDARFTMVEGPSGILSTAKPHFRPRWEPGNGLLTYPNGVKARIFSADKPESIRGPNFSLVWGDEVAHWPNLYKTWTEVIEPALRVGWARAILTTTPVRDPDLKKIEAMAGTITTRASTFDNIYLPEEVRAVFRQIYAGTRIGRQELYGEILEEAEHALWSAAVIEAGRVSNAPPLRRCNVAVDPAVTHNENSDETGITVQGLGGDGHAYVLADKTLKASPAGWARQAVAAYHRYSADCIVAEVNNGGDLVESTIHIVDENVPVKKVRASRGKYSRAEPVAALYERGSVHHVGVFEELEEQMVTWEPTHAASPDRLDALVWGITELKLDGPKVGPLFAYL